MFGMGPLKCIILKSSSIMSSTVGLDLVLPSCSIRPIVSALKCFTTNVLTAALALDFQYSQANVNDVFNMLIVHSVIRNINEKM